MYLFVHNWTPAIIGLSQFSFCSFFLRIPLTINIGFWLFKSRLELVYTGAVFGHFTVIFVFLLFAKFYNTLFSLVFFSCRVFFIPLSYSNVTFDFLLLVPELSLQLERIILDLIKNSHYFFFRNKTRSTFDFFFIFHSRPAHS